MEVLHCVHRRDDYNKPNVEIPMHLNVEINVQISKDKIFDPASNKELICLQEHTEEKEKELSIVH